MKQQTQTNQIEWKEVEIGELLDYEQPGNYIVQSEILKEKTKSSVPVLTANKSFILGYTEEKEGIYNNPPVIIFDDFTTDTKFVDFKFKVKSSAMKLLTPKSEDINLKFVFLMMKGIQLNFSTHKRYYLSVYQKRKILVPFSDGKPNLKEQERIVGILEESEKLNGKSKNVERLLDEYLKGVFYEMFGDLITNTKKWDIKTLGDICYFENGDRGKNYPSDHSKNQEGIPFINAGSLSNGKIKKIELDYITPEQYDKLSGGKFKPGDFIFCLRGSVGKFAFNKYMPKGAIASSLVIIRPNKEIAPEYLISYFNSSLCNQLVIKYDSSSSQPNLSARSVKSFEIPIPPLPLQQKFASIVEQVEKMKENVNKTKGNSEELFNSLMQKAFRGEL